MERITRDRRLTPEEVAKYNEVIRQIQEEYPPMPREQALAELAEILGVDLPSHE